MDSTRERYLEGRVAELESIMEAFREHEIDAVIGNEKVSLLRLREAEQALAMSEAWLRLSTEAGRIGLVDWDLELKDTRCNKMLSEIVGQDIDSCFSPEEWIALLHPNDRVQVRDTVTRALESGDSCDYDCRVVVNGEERWLEYHGRVFRSDDGKPVRVRGAVRDITARKQLDLEIGLAKDELERRVLERTQALHRQTLQLRKLAAQALTSEHRERRRLAKLLHDHLQQMLVAAKLQIHGVLSASELEAAREAAVKSMALMDESIDIARGVSRELRPPVLYEGGLVAALKWLSKDTRDKHELTVTVDASEDAEPEEDDLKSMLFECVRELLFNIVKYAGVSEAFVEVRRRSEDSITITVRDNGVGFDPKELALRDDPGSGLFGIRERLASMGGGLDLVSAPGRGTTVTLRAPVKLADKSPVESEWSSSDEVRGDDSDAFGAADNRTRVLVVDDHAMVRESIASMVEGANMTVVAQAADGIEAIDLVEQYEPHVVLMDLNMPGMNGIEAIRAIRQRWPGMVIIGLSVQDDEGTADALKDAGANAFVPKSHDLNQLFETIMANL